VARHDDAEGGVQGPRCGDGAQHGAGGFLPGGEEAGVGVAVADQVTGDLGELETGTGLDW
jgi:hypothetical protein